MLHKDNKQEVMQSYANYNYRCQYFFCDLKKSLIIKFTLHIRVIAVINRNEVVIVIVKSHDHPELLSFFLFGNIDVFLFHSATLVFQSGSTFKIFDNV